jgi:transcriptional regulator with XRE-family HTH domain
MQDPAFAGAFHEMEPEFQAAWEVIRLRLDQGLTQKELAEWVGTQPASISRLERAAHKPNVAFLQRVAEALGARIEIRLVSEEEAS